MGYPTDMTPTAHQKPQTMSLDEFMRNAGTDDVKKLMGRVSGGTYSGCHVCFFQATGIWIPELVPIFQKLDAMMVMRGPIQPNGIPATRKSA